MSRSVYPFAPDSLTVDMDVARSTGGRQAEQPCNHFRIDG